jgi:DNA-binding response OmpR family regulator
MLVMGDGWPHRDLLESLAVAGFGCLLSAPEAIALRRFRPGHVDVVLTTVGGHEVDLQHHISWVREHVRAPVACVADPAGVDEATRSGADVVLREPVASLTLTMLGHWLAAAAEPELVWGLWRIQLGARQIYYAGREVAVTPHQFSVLRGLVEASGAVVSTKELAARVYGTELGDDHERVVAHVRRIRRMVEPDPARPSLLLTVRGVGFRLAAADERVGLLDAHSVMARTPIPA